MAHIHRRGDKWSYVVNIAKDPVTKKRKQITKSGFRTKKEAQLAAYKIESEIADGSNLTPSKITFEQFANEWLTYYKKRVKISSVRARTAPLNLLVSTWGTMPIAEITKSMYQSRIDELNEVYSFSYIDSIHTTGNMIFKHAIRQDLLQFTPTSGFVKPKSNLSVDDIEDLKILDKFLELNELELFLDVAKKDGLYLDYLMFVTLAYTGMRIGELLVLKWSDINFDRNTISITKTLYNPSNKRFEYELLTPKTKKSIRTILIDPSLMSLLKKHQSEQLEMQMNHRTLFKDQNFIFAEETGYPRYFRKVGDRLKRFMKKTNVAKHITPHGFRHTHTSLLIEAGADIKGIQERLGHGDINTTMNIYAHMTKNVEEKTSHKFSELTKGLL
ncbi:hypothetical protein SporoP8_07120 [Sporosarcina ureae]|uniref:site-specific integrase n=1 Tax=Sporosarcina ureae TaxID=1571 RepID=UPI000A162058|nr:tyrosine-type recombinase/integrase [Sporosarcina ureae]ARJ38659.1 hypothetical protein SporoP8_07120 [Sporosarcina ureae]